MTDNRSKTSAINGAKGGRPKELEAFTGDLDGEVWKSIKGFHKYFVSNMGRLITIKDNKPMIRKRCFDKNGYCTTTLWTGGKHHPRRIHRLVLETFETPCPKGMECSHKNHIKDDNRLENLEWATHKENIGGNVRRGIGAIGKTGESNHASRLNEKTVNEIRLFHKANKVTHQQVGDHFGIPRRLASRIIARERWKHI